MYPPIATELQVNSLTSAYLDVGDVDLAEEMLDSLRTVARIPINRSLAEHAIARVALARGEYEKAADTLKREISLSRNLLPNLGLLAWVQIAIYDQKRNEFPTLADLAIKEVGAVLQRMDGLQARPEFIDPIRKTIEERSNQR